MATVRHPAFDDVTHEVPDAAVDRWKERGWVVEQIERGLDYTAREYGPESESGDASEASEEKPKPRRRGKAKDAE